MNTAPGQTRSTASLPSLSLVVIKSANVEAARDFYSLLGLSFVEEQHGNGPPHFSATVGSLVLEVYPGQGNVPTASVRLGFKVPSLDDTLAILRNSGVRIIREATDSPWGRRAVVEDPDKNRIELNE
jgi:predicted enzyme related to lactoylglutathione lyase